MSWRIADEPVEGPDDEREDDGAPEEERESSSDDDEGDDEGDAIEPLTHLSDEDYDDFVASELTSEGRVKGDPPVAAILIGLTLLIVLLWLWLA